MQPHLIHYVLENAKNNKSSISFLDRRGNYTKYDHAQIYELAKNAASYLIQNGVQKDDVVSIMLPTSIDFISSFLGTLLIGAVPTCLYPPVGLENLSEWTKKAIGMINRVKGNFLISDLKISTLFSSALKKEKIKTILVETIPSYNEFFTLDIESYKSSDLCFLQFSSGTTGEPKPVMVTNTNAITNATIMLERCGVDFSEINVINWAPLYHDMGLVGALIGSIVCGANLTLIRPDDFLRKPSLWPRAITDQKGTVTAAPNFAFGLCCKRINDSELANFDLSSLKTALCGAEAIYQETVDGFYEKFKECGFNRNAFTPTFGIAEGTLGVTFSDNQSGPKFKTFDKAKLAAGIVVESNAKDAIRICALGAPLRTVNVSIKDENLNDLLENRVGHVFISGPSVSGGYYLDQNTSDDTIKDGELKTGDEGFIYEGELYICGRIKDTIIIRGKNYYPVVFEENLCQIKELREGRIAVSSIYDEKEHTDQLVVLAEVKNEKFLEDEKRIIEEIKNVIQSMGQKAFKVELFKPRVLPRTTSGKLKRRLATQLWENGTLLNSKNPSKAFLLKTQLAYYLKMLNIKNTKLNRDKHARSN